MKHTAQDIADVSAFINHEARLIDEAKIREWHALFTSDCHYWIPIDETRPLTQSASIVNDNALALEERVYHLLETSFAAQLPKSRTIHLVSNIAIDEMTNEVVRVHSNQLISELRTGDFRQVGLGDLRMLPAAVSYELVRQSETFKIRQKVVRLINRDMAQGNLTFIL